MNGMRARTWMAATIGALALGSAIVLSTLGEATPEPAGDAPRPDDCLVEPRKFGHAGAMATPIAAPSGVLPAPDSVPPGESASDEQAAAVEATVTESIACRNAGDLRRAYALMSDRMIEGLLGGESGPAPELLAMLENRSQRVSRGERLELVSVSGVQALPDGRLRADVTTRNAETTFEDILILTESDGRWLIDEAIAVGREPRS